MPDHVNFGNFRHAFEVVRAAQFRRNNLVEIRFFNIEFRQTVADSSRLRAFENQPFILRRMLCNFFNTHFYFITARFINYFRKILFKLLICAALHKKT